MRAHLALACIVSLGTVLVGCAETTDGTASVTEPAPIATPAPAAEPMAAPPAAAETSAPAAQAASDPPSDPQGAAQVQSPASTPSKPQPVVTSTATADQRPVRDGRAHRWELRAFANNRIEVYMDSQRVPEDHIARNANHIAVTDAFGRVIERLDIPDNWRPEHGKTPLKPGAYYTVDGTELIPPKTMLGGRLEPVPAATLAHLHAEHTEGTGKECTSVASIIPGLPFDQAGVHAHDVIISVNGSHDASPEAIRTIVRASVPGDKIQFTMLRAGHRYEALVTLAAWDPKHMVHPVGEKLPTPGATASREDPPRPPVLVPTPDPVTEAELVQARARIEELERKMQAEAAVKQAIRPQAAPQPSATPPAPR